MGDEARAQVEAEMQAPTATKAKKPRGFGAISPEKRREISSRGGRSAHALGTAHEWTREQAAEAGRKGGRATHAKLHAEKTSGVGKAMAGGDSAARVGGDPPETEFSG